MSGAPIPMPMPIELGAVRITPTWRGEAVMLAAYVADEATYPDLAGVVLARAVCADLGERGAMAPWRWCVAHPEAVATLTRHGAPVAFAAMAPSDEATTVLTGLATACITAVAVARLDARHPGDERVEGMGQGTALVVKLLARAAELMEESE